MEFVDFLKAYRDLGFLGLWVITLIVFYKELKASKDEMVDVAIKQIAALEHSATVTRDNSAAVSELRQEITELKSSNDNFKEFLRGRDEGRKERAP